MLGPVFLTPVLDRMSILLQFTLGNNESYYSGMQLTVGPRGQNFRGSGKWRIYVRPNDRQTFLLLGAVKNQISVCPGYLLDP